MTHALRSRQRCVAVIAVFALLLGASETALAATAARNPFDQDVVPIMVDQRLPATTFVDQQGHRFSFADALGDTVLVGFVYTRCTDACPIITQKFGRLHELLGGGPYRFVEVTVDPLHDTVPALASYAARYHVTGHNWQLLTGNAVDVQRFIRAAGVSVIDNGHGELVHNEKLLLVAPDGRLADVVDLVAWDPSNVAAQLRHVGGESSNPIARLNYALTKTVAQLCGGSYSVASGIIDVVAALAVVFSGGTVLWWLRRRIFAQGA